MGKIAYAPCSCGKTVRLQENQLEAKCQCGRTVRAPQKRVKMFDPVLPRLP